jgi:hypothetical protein
MKATHRNKTHPRLEYILASGIVSANRTVPVGRIIEGTLDYWSDANVDTLEPIPAPPAMIARPFPPIPDLLAMLEKVTNRLSVVGPDDDLTVSIRRDAKELISAARGEGSVSK